jgi:hypothetical protein
MEDHADEILALVSEQRWLPQPSYRANPSQRTRRPRLPESCRANPSPAPSTAISAGLAAIEHKALR